MPIFIRRLIYKLGLLGNQHWHKNNTRKGLVKRVHELFIFGKLIVLTLETNKAGKLEVGMLPWRWCMHTLYGCSYHYFVKEREREREGGREGERRKEGGREGERAPLIIIKSKTYMNEHTYTSQH